MWTEALDDSIKVDKSMWTFVKHLTVYHIKDLLKREGYGIKGSLLEWFKSFLNGRQQRVVFSGKTSDWTNVLSGIP